MILSIHNGLVLIMLEILLWPYTYNATLRCINVLLYTVLSETLQPCGRPERLSCTTAAYAGSARREAVYTDHILLVSSDCKQEEAQTNVVMVSINQATHQALQCCGVAGTRAYLQVRHCVTSLIGDTGSEVDRCNVNTRFYAGLGRSNMNLV